MDYSIPEFYSNKSIFITGASGFVGKVLIEKLLSSCPDIAQIYVLLRAKRGKSSQQRLYDLQNDDIFAVADHRVPLEVRKQKIMAIEGDLTQKSLGINAQDLQTLYNQVNIVINSGANVDFTEPLDTALVTNCASVIELTAICKRMKKLECLLHISTLYSQMHLNAVSEKVYNTKTTAEALLDMSTWCNNNRLEQLVWTDSEVSEGRPNSYTFTKALAEDYLERNSQGLPVAIARLSIVLSAIQEPCRGYFNGMQTVMFITLCQSMGLLRTFQYDPRCHLDVIPADCAINALIAIVQKTSANFHQQLALKTTPATNALVYNCTDKLVPNNGSLFTLNMQLAKENLSLKAIRPIADLQPKPADWLIKWRKFYNEHLIFSVYSKILSIFGKNGKKSLINVYNEMNAARVTLEMVTSRELNVQNSNFKQIQNTLCISDQKTFNTDFRVEKSDFLDIYTKSLRYYRKYKLKEDVNDNRAGKRHQKSLNFIEFGLHTSVVLMCILFAMFFYYILIAAF